MAIQIIEQEVCMNDKSREQFEVMAVKRGLSIDKKKGNRGQEKYKYDMIQIMWEGWQASRESLGVDLPRRHDVVDEYDYFAMGYNSAIEDFTNSLTSNGVKIK